MTKGSQALTGSPRALIALQGTGLLLLTLLLIPIFWSGKAQLFLGAIFAGLGAFLLLRRPHLCVWIILTFWFVEIDPIRIRFLSIPYLASALLLIPLAISVLRDREIWVWRVPQVKIFLAIGILFLVSTWWSHFKYPITLLPALDESGRHMQLFFSRLVFLIFFLYFINTRRRIELTVWLVAGLIVAAALSAFHPLVSGGAVKRAAAAFSLADNANRLGFICLFATTFVWFYRTHGQRRRWKVLTLPLLFFLPVMALATGSRSAFLQTLILMALILKEQEGWSVAKRVRSLLLLVSVAFVLFAAMPTAQLMRATTFDPTVAAPGQQSLRQRITIIYDSLGMIASDPILGIGIGNFRWMEQAFYGRDVGNHNSYLWAFTSGGIGVLALYLLLFYITYWMLRRVERSGPRELLWLSKGLKVNLILFLVFSGFADFWLSEFLYLLIGWTVALTYLKPRQDQGLAPIRYRSNLVPT